MSENSRATWRPAFHRMRTSRDPPNRVRSVDERSARAGRDGPGFEHAAQDGHQFARGAATGPAAGLAARWMTSRNRSRRPAPASKIIAMSRSLACVERAGSGGPPDLPVISSSGRHLDRVVARPRPRTVQSRRLRKAERDPRRSDRRGGTSDLRGFRSPPTQRHAAGDREAHGRGMQPRTRRKQRGVPSSPHPAAARVSSTTSNVSSSRYPAVKFRATAHVGIAQCRHRAFAPRSTFRHPHPITQ